MKDLKWTPVRHGKIYCSPRCGGKCTYAEFQKATRDAATLAKSLGPQWEPVVWENLGWHYQVKCGVVEISPDHYAKKKVASYTCFIQTQPQFVDEGKTPKAAFKKALGKMQACFDALAKNHSQAVHAMIGGAPPRIKAP